METIEHSRSGNSTRIIIGVLLICLAGLILADNFDFYPVPWHHYIFTWQTLLIVLGLIFVTKHDSKVTGLVLIAIGAFFLFARYYDFPIPLRKMFWPVLLLFVGLSLLFSNKRRHWKPFGKIDNNDNYIDDLSIFGGSEQKFHSQNFQGGRITNIFGGSTIDLLEAKLAPGVNALDLLCIFGGSKLLIPANWKVKVEVVSIFGGISDKRHFSNQVQSSDQELVIKGLVLFGGADIKNI